MNIENQKEIYKEEQKSPFNKGAGARSATGGSLKIPNGITLIALVITIIVMLVLVAVTITMAVNGGLFSYAGKAAEDTKNAIADEQKLATGEINVNGVLYESIDHYIKGNPVKTVANLKAGEYIKYIDKNGKEIKCAVLYDASSGYGIQIVALKPVEQITLGGDTLDEVVTSYNGAIKTLNDAAGNYLNTKYALSARSIGSKPDDPTYEPEGYMEDDSVYFEPFNGLFKFGDSNRNADCSKLKELPIEGEGSFWLASRYDWIDFGSGEGSCGVCKAKFAPDFKDSDYAESLVSFYNKEAYGLKPVGNGLLPAFTLIPELQLKGEGTESSPYEFR